MAVKRFKKAFIEFILSNYIIIGDFNIDFLHPEHRIFSKLLCILNSFDLTQVVPSDTHTSHNGKNTLIDLALISLSSKLKKCSVIPPLSNSDHDGICLTLKMFTKSQKSIKEAVRTIWKYSKADFNNANAIISATDWTDIYQRT